MPLNFTKMHGLGNDFILVDNTEGNITFSPDQVQFLCDRHMGIGADGVILVEKAEGADCFMNYINADGTFAEMCGNGIRCIAKFFQDNIYNKKNLSIDTRSGVKEIMCYKDDTYSVVMGTPQFISDDFPSEPVNVENFLFECVSIGNPHAITFVDKVETIDLPYSGPCVEHDPRFPHKINVHFVEKLSDNELKMRVWERGSGVTLACGTGACAVYALALKKGLIHEEATIHLPGGPLHMSRNENGGIIMRGPAVSVFEGEVEI